MTDAALEGEVREAFGCAQFGEDAHSPWCLTAKAPGGGLGCKSLAAFVRAKVEEEREAVREQFIRALRDRGYHETNDALQTVRGLVLRTPGAEKEPPRRGEGGSNE